MDMYASIGYQLSVASSLGFAGLRLHDEISESQAQLIIHCLDAMDRSDPMVCKPLSPVIKHLHFTIKFAAKLDIRSNNNRS